MRDLTDIDHEAHLPRLLTALSRQQPDQFLPEDLRHKLSLHDGDWLTRYTYPTDLYGTHRTNYLIRIRDLPIVPSAWAPYTRQSRSGVYIAETVQPLDDATEQHRQATAITQKMNAKTHWANTSVSHPTPPHVTIVDGPHTRLDDVIVGVSQYGPDEAVNLRYLTEGTVAIPEDHGRVWVRITTPTRITELACTVTDSTDTISIRTGLKAPVQLELTNLTVTARHHTNREPITPSTGTERPIPDHGIPVLLTDIPQRMNTTPDTIQQWRSSKPFPPYKWLINNEQAWSLSQIKKWSEQATKGTRK